MWQHHSRAYDALPLRCLQLLCKVTGWKQKFVLYFLASCLKGWIINRKNGEDWKDRDVIVSLSADYSTGDSLTRNSRSTVSLREKFMLTKGLAAGMGEQHQRGQIQREVKEPVPWVMWWPCLPSDDEFDGIPTALAVLHQDRHRILPTRQRAGQRLASSFRHPHPFHTTSPTHSPHAFSCPLVESRGDKRYFN